MANRGRGRGRGFSFNVESLGFGHGETLPSATVQPPDTFPPLQFKPLPLKIGEEWDYLLAVKQEFIAHMQESPYYLIPVEQRKDVERYTDKYQLGHRESDRWEPEDWNRFPAELKFKKVVKRSKSKIQPKIPAVKKKLVDKQSVVERLEELEKQEKTGSDEEEVGEGKDEEEENNEENEEENVEEEDLEEETDYIQNYFDNGENYGVDSDDDMDDGPTY